MDPPQKGFIPSWSDSFKKQRQRVKSFSFVPHDSANPGGGRAEPKRKKERLGVAAVYPGRQSLHSFDLGYYHAAPPGLRNGEPVGASQRRGRALAFAGRQRPGVAAFYVMPSMAGRLAFRDTMVRRGAD